MTTEEILKSLTTKLRDHANYFDEDHQYERMNDLDKARMILELFLPILKTMENDNISNEIKKINEMKPFEFNFDGYIHIPEEELKKFPDPKIMTEEEYVKEKMNEPKKTIPKFDSAFVVIDATDNHILENKIFPDIEDAKKMLKEYNEQLPSLNENNYLVYNVSSDSLQYGAFPYENQIYFIYDID